MVESKPDETLLKIRRAAEYLNGKGKKIQLLNNCKYLRYFLALLYATHSSIYSKNTLCKHKKFYFTIYTIAKIGGSEELGLKLDPSKTCGKIFGYGKDNKEILEMIHEDKHYFTFSNKGEERFRTDMDELLLWMKNPQSLLEADDIHTKLYAITKKTGIKFNTLSDFKITEKYGFKVKPEIIKLILRLEDISR